MIADIHLYLLSNHIHNYDDYINYSMISREVYYESRRIFQSRKKKLVALKLVSMGSSFERVSQNKYIFLLKPLVYFFHDVLDWKSISERIYLEYPSYSFLERFSGYIDWKIISQRPVTGHFIDTFHTLLDFKEMSKASLVQSDTIVEKYIDRFELSSFWDYTYFSESFLDKYFFKLDPIIVSKRIYLSRHFINKYKEYLDWRSICRFQCLTEDMIYSNLEKIDWEYITYQPLSETFIEKHLEKMNISTLLQTQRFTCRFLDAHYDTFHSRRTYMSLICQYQELTEWYMEKYIDLLDFSKLSRYQGLSESFIRKYRDHLDFYKIAEYQYLSPQFIHEFSSEMPMRYLIRNKEISENTLVDMIVGMFYNDRVQLRYLFSKLVQRRSLSNAILKKYVMYMDFTPIIKYQNVTMDFLKEFRKEISWEPLIAFGYLPLDPEKLEEFKEELPWRLIAERYDFDFILFSKWKTYLVS